MTGALLVFWLLGSAPLNASGEPTGPSPQVGVFAVSYPDEASCKAAAETALVSWTGALDVAGVVRECRDPAAL